METRPFQSGHRFPTTDLGHSIPLFIFPTLPYSSSLEESELRPNRKTVACRTNLAVSNLVPPSTRNIYSSSNATFEEYNFSEPAGEVHPLIANRTLRVVVWSISGNDYLRRDFQKQLLNLLQVQDENVHSQVTIRPEECGLARVRNNRLMHFNVM